MIMDGHIIILLIQFDDKLFERVRYFTTDLNRLLRHVACTKCVELLEDDECRIREALERKYNMLKRESILRKLFSKILRGYISLNI